MFETLTPAENEELWLATHRAINRSRRRVDDLIGGQHPDRVDSQQRLIDDLLGMSEELTMARFPRAFRS